jgi:hypothetical protein
MDLDILAGWVGVGVFGLDYLWVRLCGTIWWTLFTSR